MATERRPQNAEDAESLDALIVEHDEFVRTLVRAMLRDEDSVDDVTQEVWLTAIRKKPTPGPGFRSWLAAVVRNHVSQRWRSDRSRRSFEQSYSRVVESRPEPVDERLRQELLDAIESLPESTRETIVQRYFEGARSDALGEEHGVAAATVRSRARRGLNELRTLLEQRLRRRGMEWRSVLVLAGLARESSVDAGTNPVNDGGVFVPRGITRSWKAVTAGGVIVAVTVTTLSIHHAAPPTTAPAGNAPDRLASVTRPSSVDAGGERLEDTSALPAMNPVGASPLAAPVTAAPVADADRVVLYVLAGDPPQPVPGARVALIVDDAMREVGATDSDGRITIEVAGGRRGALAVVAPGYEMRLLPLRPAHDSDARVRRIRLRDEAILTGRVARADGQRLEERKRPANTASAALPVARGLTETVAREAEPWQRGTSAHDDGARRRQRRWSRSSSRAVRHGRRFAARTGSL